MLVRTQGGDSPKKVKLSLLPTWHDTFETGQLRTNKINHLLTRLCSNCRRWVKRQVLGSVNSGYQAGRAPSQPRIRRDPQIRDPDPSFREEEFLAAGPVFTSAP